MKMGFHQRLHIQIFLDDGCLKISLKHRVSHEERMAGINCLEPQNRRCGLKEDQIHLSRETG